MKHLMWVLLSTLFVSCNLTPSLENSSSNGDTDTITILQTADIHGQLNTHDELFFKNEKIEFKRLGGGS